MSPSNCCTQESQESNARLPEASHRSSHRVMDQQTPQPHSAEDLNTSQSRVPARQKRKRADDEGDGDRKRVSQACDTCRSKKLKCDGARPVCSSCVSQRRQCLYGTVTKKRGLPEGYVRGMEKLLGLLISRDGKDEVNASFQIALDDPSAKEDLIRQWNGQLASGETLAERWRESRLCKALEALLPELDAPDTKILDSKRPRSEHRAVGMDKTRTRIAEESELCPSPGDVPYISTACSRRKEHGSTSIETSQPPHLENAASSQPFPEGD